MNTNHSHFEVLCALAGSEQLTNTEMAELRQHSERCPSCSGRLVEINRLSVQLFCAHALNQPGVRMPKGVRDRFIARANSEGVPLSSRTLSAGLGTCSWAAALVLALLLMSATLRFGPRTNLGNKTVQADQAGVSGSLGKRKVNSLGVSGNDPSNEVRADRTYSHLNTQRKLHGTFLSVSRTAQLGQPSRFAPDGSQYSQFDPSRYSRNFTMFSRPFPGVARLADSVQWSPAKYVLPKLDFAEPLDLIREGPPRLLAECEHRTFALWSPQGNFNPGTPDAQTLRHDFDPDAYRTLLNRGFRENLPTFQFIQKTAN